MTPHSVLFFGNVIDYRLTSPLQPVPPACCVRKFALMTFMVIDTFFNGLPVAWVISSSETAECMKQYTEAMWARVRQEFPAFRPSCFIVDDCGAALKMLRCAQYCMHYWLHSHGILQCICVSTLQATG